LIPPVAGAVAGDEEVEPALGGLHLGDVDVDVADGMGLEGLPGWLVALDFRQSGDAVAPKAAMQRGTGQVRHGGLERAEAIVERQQGVAAEGDDVGLLLSRQRGGVCPPWAGR
jgi:hypothetical protein